MLPNIFCNSISYGRFCVLGEPENPEILSELGHASIRMNGHSRAMEHLNKAVSLKPEYAQAYLFRGFLYGQMEKYERAVSDFSWGH